MFFILVQILNSSCTSNIPLLPVSLLLCDSILFRPLGGLKLFCKDIVNNSAIPILIIRVFSATQFHILFGLLSAWQLSVAINFSVVVNPVQLFVFNQLIVFNCI